MGKTRICGKRCHNAVGGKCRCWCGGTFHGAPGLDAREEFRATFTVDVLPTTFERFDRLTQPTLFGPEVDAWRARVAAGLAARWRHASREVRDAK